VDYDARAARRGAAAMTVALTGFATLARVDA